MFVYKVTLRDVLYYINGITLCDLIFKSQCRKIKWALYPDSKAFGNSLSQELFCAKFFKAISGNFVNSGGNCGEFVGVLSFLNFLLLNMTFLIRTKIRSRLHDIGLSLTLKAETDVPRRVRPAF